MNRTHPVPRLRVVGNSTGRVRTASRTASARPALTVVDGAADADPAAAPVLTRGELERLIGMESGRCSSRDATATLVVVEVQRGPGESRSSAPSSGVNVVRIVAQALRLPTGECPAVAVLTGPRYAAVLPGADPSVTTRAAERALAALERTTGRQGAGAAAVVVFGGGEPAPASAILGAALLALSRPAAAEGSPVRHVGVSGRISQAPCRGAVTITDRSSLSAQPVAGLCGADGEEYEMLVRQSDDQDRSLPAPVVLGGDDLIAVWAWALEQTRTTLDLRWASARPVRLRIALPHHVVCEKIERLLTEAAGDAWPCSALTLDVRPATLAEPDRSALVQRLAGLGYRVGLDVGSQIAAAEGHVLTAGQLKVDGAELCRLGTSADHVLQALQAARIRLVATGVADQRWLRELRCLGVHAVQGSALGRPLPADTYLR